MASLIYPKTQEKGPSIQWSDAGHRKTLYLGKCPKRFAEAFVRHVEALIDHNQFGEALDRKTIDWLQQLNLKWREKLKEKGLLEAHAIATVGDLVEHCLQRVLEAGGSEASITKVQNATVNLLSYFDPNQSIHAITPADAGDYATWLRANGRRDGRGRELASTTAGKQLQTVAGMFRRAVLKDALQRNPFEGVTIRQGAADAQQYVPVDVIQRVLRHCSPGLAVRVALGRFAGLRHPSEVEALEIEWVNLPERRMLAYSPKNARYEHKRYRELPIDAALVPYLEDAIETAEPGERYVAHVNRGVTATAWRNALERACKRAAVVPWSSLWHSLRGSRAVDLLDSGLPEHVVCSWQNTGAKELRKHYLRPTAGHFEHATGLPAAAADQAEPRVGARIAALAGDSESRPGPAREPVGTTFDAKGSTPHGRVGTS